MTSLWALAALLPLAVASPIARGLPSTPKIILDLSDSTCQAKCTGSSQDQNNCVYQCQLAQALKLNPAGMWYSSKDTACQFGCTAHIAVADRVEIACLGKSGTGQNVHNTGDSVFDLVTFVSNSLSAGCSSAGGCPNTGTWMAWTTNYYQWDNSNPTGWHENVPASPPAAWNSDRDTNLAELEVNPYSTGVDTRGYGSLKLTATMETNEVLADEIVNKLKDVINSAYQGSLPNGSSVIDNEALMLTQFGEGLFSVAETTGVNVNTQRGPKAVSATLTDQNGTPAGTLKYKISICDPKVYENSCSEIASILGVLSAGLALAGEAAGPAAGIAGFVGAAIGASCMDDPWSNDDVPQCQ